MSSSGYLDLVTNNKVYLQDAGFFVCAHCTEVSFSEDIKGQVNETLTCPNCRTESLIHSQFIKDVDDVQKYHEAQFKIAARAGTDPFMNIRFEKHKGKQHKDDGYVIFYGIKFSSILPAAALLRHIPPGNYDSSFYKRYKILVNADTRTVYTRSRTWANISHFSEWYHQPSAVRTQTLPW